MGRQVWTPNPSPFWIAAMFIVEFSCQNEYLFSPVMTVINKQDNKIAMTKAQLSLGKNRPKYLLDTVRDALFILKA